MQTNGDALRDNRVEKLIAVMEGIERRIDPHAAPESDQILAELTRAIGDALTACNQIELGLLSDRERLRSVQVRFREMIWPWFSQSWFMHRALTKPRGYPGDYELLSAIYARAPKSSGLGGYLDRYFLNTTLGRAVPARMASARRFLLDEIVWRPNRVAILNVACGPCREYVEGFAEAGATEIAITCIDNDPESLEFVRTQVIPAVTGNVTITLHRYNALRMTSPSANVRRFGRSDIIYSVGLCDYIPDEYLVPMLKGWRESLNEGGVVYVAFKDSRLYDTAEYQWLVDWYFLQRTEEDCRGLFAEAGYDMTRLQTSRAASGVIINFIGHAKPEPVIRLDGAERLPLTQHLDSIIAPLHQRLDERT